MQCEYLCGQTEEFFVEEKVWAPEPEHIPPAESERREKQGHVRKRSLTLCMNPCQVRILAQNVRGFEQEGE